MSIELHCPQCSKLIKAPDNAGGRYGKCPYCERRVYIPVPPEERDEIGIAPVDENEEERERRLRQEAIALESELAHESPRAPAEGAAPGGRGEPRETAGEVVDLAGEVKRFLVSMRDSKLEKADAAVARLKRAGQRARDYVQGMMVDEMPLEVDNVPPPVVKGLLKSLLGQLEE